MAKGKDAGRDLVIGFDLGGTKMLCAVLDREYRELSREKRKVQSEGTAEIGKQIIDCIQAALKSADVEPDRLIGIGIGVPGTIDRKKSLILQTPNLSLDHFPLGDRLEKEFGVPILLENDVNAGTYGEYVRGAGRGYRHVLGVFPGTGIGGGLILDGRLYRGATGNAGEVGHMIIQTEGRLCGCGQYGCLEALASRTALSKDAAGLAASGSSEYLMEKGGSDLRKIRSGTLAKAIESGDEQVKQLVDRSVWFLGIGLANLVNILSPEVIVLGGGLVEKFGKTYVEETAESMHRHSMPSMVKDVKVVSAALGDDAVFLGAAALLAEREKERGGRYKD